MRNQSLLHRQLGMLDSMERKTSEPGALADLFRLDHLTTRMRRHAEGLIILSGSTPGRGLARSGARRRRAARRGRRGRGLRPGRRGQRIARPGRGQRGQRHHPPARRARGERHGLLPAQHPDRGQGRPGGHRPRRGDRRPRPRPVRRRTRRHQPAPRQPARVRPGQQRAARAVRRQPAGGPARHQGLAPPVRLRRHHGRSSCCRSAWSCGRKRPAPAVRDTAGRLRPSAPDRSGAGWPAGPRDGAAAADAGATRVPAERRTGVAAPGTTGWRPGRPGRLAPTGTGTAAVAPRRRPRRPRGTAPTASWPHGVPAGTSRQRAAPPDAADGRAGSMPRLTA